MRAFSTSLAFALLKNVLCHLHLRDAFRAGEDEGRQVLKAVEQLGGPQPWEHKGGGAEAPIIDRFFIVYWGVVASIAAAGYFYTKKRVEIPHRESFKQAEWANKVELPNNMYALILVAAIGQARYPDGSRVNAWHIAGICLFMGSVQIAAIVLMTHDLNHNADTWTAVSSSPYGNEWTVNSAKFIMTLLMGIAMVGEAGQSHKVITTALAVDDECLMYPRALSISFEIFHYVVAVFVLWGGVAVILSFQSVPQIVLGSLAITAISNVDEMFYTFFEATLSPWKRFDVDEEKVTADNHSHVFRYVLRWLTAFPMLFGFFLLFRAWYTGFMPTQRIYTMFGKLGFHSTFHST